MSSATPHRTRSALLLIDVINHMDFPGAGSLVAHALPMARRIQALKARLKAAGVPCIYCNDNFGRWRSDFRALVEHCVTSDVPGRPVASLLKPEPDDYFVLKPKHSAFYATPLDLLLRELGANRAILAGVAGNLCVLFSAHDAYMRDYLVHVPSDCVASNTREENDAALAQMETACKADLTASSALALEDVA
jgi:nicotinamidase-related amidase